MNELYHYGIKDQKWGVRRFQNPDGSLTEEGKRRYRANYRNDDVVFISGKVKFDEPIPNTVKNEIDQMIRANSSIVIGDAPGADTRVQDYLQERGYHNVRVYTTDMQARNNVGDWPVNRITGTGQTEREIRRLKDIAMTTAATRGYVITTIGDRLDSATSLNIQRLLDRGLYVRGYDYVRGQRL